MYLFYLLNIVQLSLSLFSYPQIQHVSSQELAKIIENPDYLTMTIIYDESTPGSIALDQVLVEILPKYENYVKFVALDCDQVPEICKPEIRSQMPVFQGYAPGGINPYTNKPLVNDRPYQGRISAKDIGDYFTEHVPYLGEFLTQENNEKFLEEKGNKVLLFTNKEKVPIIFKGLSSKFRARLEFGVVFVNQTELVTQYDVINFPSLIVIEGEDVVQYKGKIDFSEISEFLLNYQAAERWPLKAKRVVKQTQPQEPEAKLPSFPVHALTLSNYKDHLLEDSGLYLVQFYKDKQLDQWDSIQSSYNGVLKMASFNCKNKEALEVCQNLGAKKFPSIRIFPVNRKRKSFEVSIDNKEDFEEEISRELRYDIMNIQEATVQTFVNSIQEEMKVGFLLINEGYLPLQIKGVAAEESFKDFAKFGYFNRPREVALSIFSIKNYPAFIAFAKNQAADSLQVIEYTGEFNDYSSLFYFIDEVALPNFSTKKKKKVSEEDQDEIELVRNSNEFNLKCLKKGGLCLIGLFEGNVKFT